MCVHVCVCVVRKGVSQDTKNNKKDKKLKIKRILSLPLSRPLRAAPPANRMAAKEKSVEKEDKGSEEGKGNAKKREGETKRKVESKREEQDERRVSGSNPQARGKSKMKEE